MRYFNAGVIDNILFDKNFFAEKSVNDTSKTATGKALSTKYLSYNTPSPADLGLSNLTHDIWIRFDYYSDKFIIPTSVSIGGIKIAHYANNYFYYDPGLMGGRDADLDLSLFRPGKKHKIVLHRSQWKAEPPQYDSDSETKSGYFELLIDDKLILSQDCDAFGPFFSTSSDTYPFGESDPYEEERICISGSSSESYSQDKDSADLISNIIIADYDCSQETLGPSDTCSIKKDGSIQESEKLRYTNLGVTDVIFGSNTYAPAASSNLFSTRKAIYNTTISRYSRSSAEPQNEEEALIYYTYMILGMMQNPASGESFDLWLRLDYYGQELVLPLIALGGFSSEGIIDNPQYYDIDKSLLALNKVHKIVVHCTSKYYQLFIDDQLALQEQSRSSGGSSVVIQLPHKDENDQSAFSNIVLANYDCSQEDASIGNKLIDKSVITEHNFTDFVPAQRQVTCTIDQEYDLLRCDKSTASDASIKSAASIYVLHTPHSGLNLNQIDAFVSYIPADEFTFDSKRIVKLTTQGNPGAVLTITPDETKKEAKDVSQSYPVAREVIQESEAYGFTRRSIAKEEELSSQTKREVVLSLSQNYLLHRDTRKRRIVLLTERILEEIADAIRYKLEIDDMIEPVDFAQRIMSIPTQNS